MNATALEPVAMDVVHSNSSIFIEETTSNSACMWSFCNNSSAKVATNIRQQQHQRQHQHPQSGVQDEEADKYLAREMAELTVEQRERYAEEIHGVTVNVPQETPEFVEKRLAQMEEEIVKVRTRSEYNRAHFLNPSMVGGRPFRLMFLRNTLFDPRLAARRIIDHFKYKAELFPEEKLAVPITHDDLDADDREALYTAAHQAFRCGTDSVGRAVLWVLRGSHEARIKSWKNAVRATWYHQMSMLQDEEVQRRGVIIISYDVCVTDWHPAIATDMVRKQHIIKDGIPLRLAAFHYCYDNIAIRSAFAVLRTVAGTDFRLRLRDHYGSHQECQYALRTFGICHLPFDFYGNLNTEEYFKQLQDYQEKEKIAKLQQYAVDKIGAANNRDVLLGKGWSCQNHRGNLELARLIEERQTLYHNASKFDKVCMSWELLRYVQNEIGGRFLKMDETSGVWQLVSDEQAREKVANGFRSNKKHRGRGIGDGHDMFHTTDKRLRVAY